jgi:DNA transposition AAA+ family ATPase
MTSPDLPLQPADFIVTKEYRRFAEFCDACGEAHYMGLCYDCRSGKDCFGASLCALEPTGGPVIEHQWEQLGLDTALHYTGMR